MKIQYGKGLGLAMLLIIGALCGCSEATQTVQSNADNAVVSNEKAAVDMKAAPDEAFHEPSIDSIKIGTLAGGASVHDPSIITGEDGSYYIFGSHMAAARSMDLRDWKSFADGVGGRNPLFSNLFTGDEYPAFSYVGKNSDGWYSVWAPDVIYNKAMGKYVMYFCTTSTYIMSNLCFATADNIEGPYEYQDTFLYSGFIRSNLKQTNFLDYVDKSELDTYTKSGLGFNNQYWPNCIDPTVFYDKDGRMWMTYGSWSGGIFLLEIDEETGYPIHPEKDEENQVDPYYGRRLVGGYHQSIEGPYILYDETTDYYYLFVSCGSLTSNGGYQIRQFRSRDVEGPYTDTKGQTCTMVDSANPEYNKEYGLKMMGNYQFPSLEKAYMAPGHNSAFIDQDGKMYVVYHQRFDDGKEYHQPRVHQLFANQDGWLVAAPFAVSGETLKEDGYTAADLAGTYYVVNHGTEISAKISPTKCCAFYSDGTVYSDDKDEKVQIGSYEVETGTPYVTVTIKDEIFRGVMVEMTDEAGNQVMCFTGASDQNETLWGVHYR